MSSSVLCGNVDLGNVVFLEHVNVNVTDKDLAGEFYFNGLGLTRDPFERVGFGTMWANCGRQQIHLPHDPEPNTLRGRVVLVFPSLDTLLESLSKVSKSLAKFKTKFSYQPFHQTSQDKDLLKINYLGHDLKGALVTCPWGNQYLCFQSRQWPSVLTARGSLGIPLVEFYCPLKSLPAIQHVYKDLLGAVVDKIDIADDEKQTEALAVVVGPNQKLVFIETDDPVHLRPYDGYHIQIYVANFCGSYQKLFDEKLLWNNPRFGDRSDTLELALSNFQFRFKDFRLPGTDELVYELEHEVRATIHPFYGRTLVNKQGFVGIYGKQ
jgi:hypothetical protein